MARLVVFVAMLLLVPSASFAGWINRAGESLPETDARKSVGDFGAHLIFVGNENGLISRWAIPSETVEFASIDSVPVNGAINAFVIFSGCKKNDAGNCSVAMRFRVIKPDGSIYAETPPMEVWHNKPAPAGHNLELSVEYLKVIIEPTDPLGTYEIQAQVRDHHSGQVLQLKGPFTAVQERH